MIIDCPHHLNIKQALSRSPGNDADLAGVDQQGGARGLAPGHRRHHQGRDDGQQGQVWQSVIPWERGGVVANFERCVEPGCHRTIHQVGFPTLMVMVMMLVVMMMVIVMLMIIMSAFQPG